MAATEWKVSYGTGSERIDAQHRELAELVDLLDDPEMTGLALERLKSLVQEHFHDEEALLWAVGYPDLAIKKTLHRKFEDWLAQAHRRYVTGGDSGTVITEMREHLTA